jgi:ubiquinone/menaquinone biosynthesis C-methylase UbiE
VDFSEDMILAAEKQKKIIEDKLIGKLYFEKGDVLELKETEQYDVVLTDRCLINLGTLENQIKAIDNIYDVLKENGKYLMMECTIDGLNKINSVRHKFGLEDITERWHNLYLDEQPILNHIKNKFRHVEINNFNSTFFLLSRTLNALLTTEGEPIDYNSNLNKYAAMLPPLGDYAPLKLIVITK